MSDHLYHFHQPSFWIQTKQSIEGDSVTYEIKIAKALLEDTPDTTRADGLFHRGNIQLIVRNEIYGMEPEEVADWVVLEPETLPMILLRLAYLAAFHQEGPYGADESERLSQSTD
jgi:hypothetical protein